MIDADGQHDPADIPRLVETQRQEETDIVIGSRYIGKRTTKIPFVRSLGLGVINHLTNVSLGTLRPSGFIRDTQSGYRAYSRYATKSLANDRSIGNNRGKLSGYSVSTPTGSASASLRRTTTIS
ncbi:MAG: glycosyltransferase family 2 protein [Halobacteriales archaeon]|nr:glycosyltransferase family 2 protein [Halobacteriales archaeon]